MLEQGHETEERVSRRPRNQAFWVARQGEEGRAVLAGHPLSALVEAVLSGDDDAAPEIAQFEARRRDEGWSASVDGALWTVRPHRPDTTDGVRRGIEGASDVRAACARALKAAREAVPSDSGAVLLLEGRYLQFVVADGPEGPSLEGVRLPPTTGVAGYAVQTQRPQIVGDPGRHPRHYAAIDAITGYATRQILAVPAVAGGVVLGVIELMNPPGGRRFEPSDAEVVERYARVLADWLARRRRRG